LNCLGLAIGIVVSLIIVFILVIHREKNIRNII
jgi:hypothetical protein